MLGQKIRCPYGVMCGWHYCSCREACAVWCQCRWVQTGADRVQVGVGVVQKLLGLVCIAQSADNQSYFVQKCRVQTKWLKTE